MSAFSLGPIHWSMKMGKDFHRDYSVRFRVKTTDVNDGPLTVLSAAGLPTMGSIWNFGNDTDLWAYCWPEISVTPQVDRKINNLWIVQQLFSTRPLQRCQDTNFENPLSEPPKISGSFTKYDKKARQDYQGKMLRYSNMEPIYSLTVDANRPNVSISMNSASLGLETFSQMINTVNDSDMWGLSKRKIMLANVTWSRNLYGTCTFYYTRTFDFEIRYEGFDIEDVLDEGFKVRRGRWAPLVSAMVWTPDAGTDEDDPNDYEVFKDQLDHPFPTRTALDGHGNPNPDPKNNPIFVPTIKLATESNLLSLGIPSTL